MVALSIEEKIALSNIRAEKSKEAINDAIGSLNAGMFKTSANRSYYAVLHAARSLLILHGSDPLKHDGVKTMIALHFVKTNILPTELIDIFKDLLALRSDVDYGDFESVDKDDAEDAIEQAKRFIEIIETVREQLIKEMSS
jgi:uncharacterized protein (UPF0332 family)